MRLLTDEELERSAVVANCRMNRERELRGSNGYARELGFDPVEFLRDRGRDGRDLAWLDLCCGSGRALGQAAEEGLRLEIVGVDLVGGFDGLSRPGVRLIAASLSGWRADREFDLITSVHGLHYVGDKLGLIGRASSWLSVDGRFVANMDLRNLRVAEPGRTPRGLAADLRRAGLDLESRNRRVLCRGRRALRFPYRYLGADDGAGPNFTGQAAVDSHYEREW